MSDAAERRLDDGLAAAPVFAAENGVVRLLGSSCARCRAVAFPRRAVCVRCGGDQVPVELTGAGRVHAWTRIANPPAGFDGDLLYGCVDLDEGPRVLAPLAGAPRIGARVQAVPGRVRGGALGFRFRTGDA